MRRLYEAFAASGVDSLSKREDHFWVGATKTLNFMFPELFVMVDSNIRKAFHKGPDMYFPNYWNLGYVKKSCVIGE